MVCLTVPGLSGCAAPINMHCNLAQGVIWKGYPITSQRAPLSNERALRPMQLPSKLSGDFIWFDFLHFIPTPSKKGWKFSSAPSLTFKKKRKEDKHLYIDCHLTFTVLVIYMVIQGCMSHFSSHLSLSPHYKSAEAGTPPVYQDKAIWMYKAVSSTTKGLSLKEQARLLHQSHSSTHLHIFTSRLHN